jgi:hypothetical protein
MPLKEIHILPSTITPEISLNPEGKIKIKGRSMNEDLSEFYKQTEGWIDEYICNPADLTCVEIYLEYFNEINLYVYISMLKKISSLKLKNKKYIINWYYEEGDEDILEKGENISFILNIPFNFIKIHDPLLPEYNSLKWKHNRKMRT